MDHVYAVGVNIVESVQYWLKDYDSYFEFVNDVTNPNVILEILFPLISVVDSVFAAQLLLCSSFGNWLNAIFKWWLQEDRPYWWVRTTDYYPDDRRPVIRQFRHTCETGPGSPSGHSEAAAILLVLCVCWVLHVMNDRKVYVWWWKLIVLPLCALVMTSVMLARVYVGTHFPHQVLFGALLGAIIGPGLCVYVIDPFIWRYGSHSTTSVSRGMKRHVAGVIVIVIITAATYYSMKLTGHDPQWSTKLAFRWCENPESIHVSTTPVYALSLSVGLLLGGALGCTPNVAEYRHYTKDRSLLISAFSTALYLYLHNWVQNSINRDRALYFYLSLFLISAVKVPVLLRLIPALAKWPFKKEKVKTS